MKMRAVGLVAAVLTTCLPGCVDLNEDVITGLTPGAYGSEAVFQALVNASYEPGVNPVITSSFRSTHPGRQDLNEDVITGLTPGAYGSEAVFQALVNASYEPGVTPVITSSFRSTHPGRQDLNEDVITGLTPGAYGSEAVFQALVNASYEPLRSFWAQERGFTLTEFGTDIYTKGADGSYKFVNDYTTQLNPTVDYFTNSCNDFYRAINTINPA